MRRDQRSQDGITLIEVLISVVILTMITGGIVTSMLTALNISSPTNHRVDETNDSQLIATFLTRDAQAAGGTDPSTGSLDTTNSLGVSTTDPAGCVNASGTLVLRFKWFDRTPTLTAGQQNVVAHIANYYFVAASNQLVRTTCDSGATAVPPSAVTPAILQSNLKNITLANTVASVAASCNPSACPSLPDTVSLTVTATNKTAGSQNPTTSPYTYTVTASLRPEGETPPCDATVAGCTTPTGTINPVITLGGTCNADNVSGLDVGGSTQVDVNGGITLAGGVPGCAASHFHLSNNGSFQSGQIDTLGQIVDPFAGLAPPPDTCATSTSNPAPSGGHYHPGTYKTDPSIGGNTTVVFDAGNYVFCAGLTISGNNTNVSGTGVLIYIKGGTLNLNGGTVNLTAQSSGTYAGLLIWQAAADTTGPMVISGNSALTLNGIIYAPSIEVQLRGGANTFFVKAIIAGSVSFSGTSGITIGTPPPQLFISTPTSLPSWTVGVPYPTIALTSTGGSGGNTWTVTGLPDGLTFNPGANTITGTPTVPGLFSPQIKLVDSDGDIAIAVYSVTINGALSITGPATLPSADVGRDYPPPSKTAVMTSAGGTAPYTWSATGLPPGLAIDASSGAISNPTTTGPTTIGTYSPTITLTDGAGATTSRTYPNGITINPLPDITAPSGPSLPSWTTGQSGYSQQITVTGGTGPYTWQLSGAPPGLSINNSGLITGKPTGPQTYSLVVTVTDAGGVAASQSYSLTINPSLSIDGTVPDGEINVAYNATLTANNGTGPYTWTPPSGLPPGLTFTPSPTTATLSGTPTVANTYTLTVTLTDSTGTTVTQTYSFVINPAPTINATTLPSWTINQDYGNSKTTMKGTGGLTPYAWSATGMPTGLSIDASSGQITGSPTATGTYTVVITLTDAKGVQATQSNSVTINPLPSISTTSLPDGELTVAYSQTVTATGGTPFAGGLYNWKISSGPPPGLSINANTGVISGTPTTSGTFQVTIVATDAAGATVTTVPPLSLVVNAAPSVTSTSLAAATQTQVGYSQTLQSAGGNGSVTWSLASGTLPTGLSLSPSGVISGNVGAGATSQTFTVRATDPNGGWGQQTLTLTVNPRPSVTSSSLAAATQTQVGYSRTLQSSGGTGTISWSLTSGTLPTGLSLSPTGVISGDVGAAATTQTFTVTATDSNAVPSTATSVTIVVNLPPTVTTTSCIAQASSGGSSKSFSLQLTNNRGTPGFTWTATSLPGFANLTSGGLLTGTAPNNPQTFNFTVTATDANNVAGSATFTLTIQNGGGGTTC